ncbi:MAG: TRAP transporter small permease, partial [bacterium]
MFKSFTVVISKIVEAATCVLLTALVVIISYQVFSRFVLNTTPYWTEEISLVLVVWFGLLGAGLGVRDGAHLAVEFLVRLFPEGIQQSCRRLSYAMISCFAVVMVVSGGRLVLMTTGQTLPATNLPVAITYLAIPLGGLFIL